MTDILAVSLSRCRVFGFVSLLLLYIWSSSIVPPPPRRTSRHRSGCPIIVKKCSFMSQISTRSFKTLKKCDEKKRRKCATISTAKNLWYALYVSHSFTLSLSPQSDVCRTTVARKLHLAFMLTWMKKKKEGGKQSQNRPRLYWTGLDWTGLSSGSFSAAGDCWR